MNGEVDASATLGAVVVELARRCADAWSAGDLASAAVFACGAWRLVGDADFLDCDGCE